MVSVDRRATGLKQIRDSCCLLLANFPNPVLLLNLDTSIEYVNPALEKIVGFSKAAVAGRKAPYPWWTEGAPYKTRGEFEKAMCAGERTIENIFNKSSGEIFWVEIVTAPIVTDGGKPSYYLSCWTDVTEREQAWEALRESEHRFHRLADAAFEGILIHENLKILEVNDVYAKMHGYEPSELIGMSALDLVASESRDLSRSNVSSGNEHRREQVHLKKDGTRFAVEVVGKNAFYNGRPVRVSAVTDITERKLMEDKLRKSEEKLRVTFESIVEGVIICDTRGNIENVNDAAVYLYGCSDKEEMIGHGFLELMAAEEHTRAKRDRQLTTENGRTQSAEYVCQRKDGTKFDGELSIALLGDNYKRPVGFVIVIRNVTERKRDRQNILYYVSEITRAQEEERKRIARELHDETIQSLSSLSLELETIMRRENELSDAVTGSLRCVLDKTHDVIKEVRRFSHELRPDILDQLGLVPALEILGGDLNKEGAIRASVEAVGCERRLPPEIELAFFRIAQEALKNARRHSEAKAVAIQMEFAEDLSRLSITDDGKGFDPFTLREHATKGKLGLIGMRERARLVDGELWIKSEIGKGTTVAVEVKVRQESPTRNSYPDELEV